MHPVTQTLLLIHTQKGSIYTKVKKRNHTT